MTYHPLVNLGDGLAGRLASGPGERVLWIHGYALDSSTWGELWDLLPDLHHVGVDLPGHGRSLPLPTGQQLPELARRVAMQALRHGVRHVVALSVGTVVALQMAIEHPGAFASLVLGSPVPSSTAAAESFWKRYRELANMSRMAGHGEHLRGRLMLVAPSLFSGVRERSALWDRLWAVVGEHPFWDLADASLLRLARKSPTTAQLRAVAVPTLVVAGEKDAPSGRRRAAGLTRALPRCERLDLPGVSRLSLLEAPAEAARAIGSHVRAHSPAGRGEEEP